jgi:ATP-dependent Clp protease adapter protein ClpS
MKTFLSPRLDIGTETDIESDILTIPRPDDGDTDTGDGFRVIIYNDDHTPIDAVVKQIIKATGCSTFKATRVTLEAHRKGRAVCYKGDKTKCHKVALVLREIRLQCEVDND